jgi:hypothetical protein
MVGRHDGHELAALSLRVARSRGTSLFGPPFGLLYSLVEILGESEEKGIGQNDRFAMV